jgi:hypothetical protein
MVDSLRRMGMPGDQVRPGHAGTERTIIPTWIMDAANVRKVAMTDGTLPFSAGRSRGR